MMWNGTPRGEGWQGSPNFAGLFMNTKNSEKTYPKLWYETSKLKKVGISFLNFIPSPKNILFTIIWRWLKTRTKKNYPETRIWIVLFSSFATNGASPALAVMLKP